jgi:hypothetical protein
MKPPIYSVIRKIMKKIIAAAFLTLCFGSALYAQDFEKFKIAFKISPNASWMSPQTQYLEAAGSSIRFGFGANVDVHFTENYAIGTGLNIDDTGGKVKYFQAVDRVDRYDNMTSYIIERERDYKIKNIEIPVTLKLRTNEIGYITYWGQFGVGVGFRQAAKATDTDRYILEFDDSDGVQAYIDSSREFDTYEQIDAKDDVADLRASLIIAGGIEYNIAGSTSVLVGLTFNNGFTDVLTGSAIEKKDNGEPLMTTEGSSKYKLKSYSNHLALTLGVLF